MQARQAKQQVKRERSEKPEDNVLRIQTEAAKRRGMTLEEYRRMRDSGNGRNATKAKARRQKKDEIRAKTEATKGDAMEIG
jgi:hypothetical protein